MTGFARDSMSERQTARQLHAEIAGLRGELTILLGELDRRRHRVLDTRDQVKRHAPGMIATGVAVLGAAAGLLWFFRERGRRRRQPIARAERLRQAVGRMIEQPERVATEPGVPGKILTAMASAALATTTKNVVERGIRALLDGRHRVTSGHGKSAEPAPTKPAEIARAELAHR